MGMMINRRRVMGGGEPPYLAKLILVDDSKVIINGEGTLTAAMVADYVSTCKYFVAGDKCTAIGENVMNTCASLVSLTLSDSVITMAANSFSSCPSLELLDFGHGIQTLGNNCFNTVTSLRNLHIPASLTAIGRYFCEQKGNLSTISVEDGNQSFDSRGDCNCMIAKADDAILVGCVNSVIPNSCKQIGKNYNRAFRSLPITHISIPESVTTISSSSFMGTWLENLDIPNNVTVINQSAFQACNRLTYVVIGTGLRTLRAQAFASCTKLISVTIKATTPPAAGTNLFVGRTDQIKIYVPAESVEAYKTASGWSTYATRIQAIPT